MTSAIMTSSGPKVNRLSRFRYGPSNLENDGKLLGKHGDDVVHGARGQFIPEDLHDGPRSTRRLGRAVEGGLAFDPDNELVEGQLLWGRTGVPALVEDPSHEQRELGGQMDRDLGTDAVAEGVQYRPQGTVGTLPVVDAQLPAQSHKPFVRLGNGPIDHAYLVWHESMVFVLRSTG